MRNVKKLIDNVEIDKYSDLTANELNYLKDNCEDLFDLIYNAFKFGYAVGKQSKERK